MNFERFIERKSKSEILWREDNIVAVKIYVDDEKILFAYFGKPKTEQCRDGFPAAVLVHGGLGFADKNWVKDYTERGYVAVAADYNGCMFNRDGNLIDNPRGGPKGYGCFSDSLRSEDEISASWFYFSVCGIIACHNFLLEKDYVDKTRTVLTGISWGGVLGLIALGCDDRFSAASVIYSSAYLDGALGSLKEGFEKLTPSQQKFYMKNYDPSNYIKNVRTPVLFLAGINDDCFSVPSRVATARDIPAKKKFAYMDLVHGHNQAVSCEQTHYFFNSVFKKKEFEICRLKSVGGNIVIEGNAENVSAFCATDISLPSNEWRWEECQITERGGAQEIVLPLGASAAYLRYDEGGIIFSTNVIFLQE